MIKHWLVTGDTHGLVIPRLDQINKTYPDYIPQETAVIILGDAGINFYLNKTDKKLKKAISETGYIIYCLRGNHEQRPELIPGMTEKFDSDVDQYVYCEEEFPCIRYFKDGWIYKINDHSVLTIGGAYSVDKYWRLARAAGRSFSGWFNSEQLTKEEMEKISESCKGISVDFVFTHTAPIDWEPTDLFLSSVDQSTVEKDMEYWLKDLKENLNWKVWLFGHYHADRIERHSVEQFFSNVDDIETIWDRWNGPITFYDNAVDFSISPFFSAEN